MISPISALVLLWYRTFTLKMWCLRFCFEKKLLKKNPLDRQDRIFRMVYINLNLTEAGKYLFPRLLQKFLIFIND